MPQLSLYLDDATMKVLRNDAEQTHVSLSCYVRELIVNRAHSAWSQGFWSTYGALDDPSFVIPAQPDFMLDDIPVFD